MLNLIRSIFGNRTISNVAVHASAHIITNRFDVLEKLLTLKSARQMIRAEFQNMKLEFQTIIVGIDSKSNTLNIDLPIDSSILEYLSVQDSIEFCTIYHGIECRFIGFHPIIKEDKLGKLINLKIPKTMYWRENRSHKRVKIPQWHLDTYALICNKNRSTGKFERNKFQILDLSSSGFQLLNLSRNPIQYFKEGDEYSAILYLSGYEISNIEFSIQHVEKIIKNGKEPIQIIGCRFKKNPLAIESRIQSYIQNIEIKSALPN